MAEVKIHLKPHVAAYLKENFGASEVISLKGKSYFNHFFFDLVQISPTPVRECSNEQTPFIIQFPDEVQLEGKRKDFRNKFLFISLEGQEKFNKSIEMFMQLELFVKLDTLVELGHSSKKNGKIKESIYAFLDKYKIDDSNAHERLRKSYYRYQKTKTSIIQMVL